MNKRIKILSCSGIVFVMLMSSVILADDDDDEEGEHHSRTRIESSSGGSARELGALPVNASYKNECTSCHMSYHPGLLPERSWKKMMNSLNNHFGEDASLDAKTKSEIEKFLVDHSIERSNSRRSQKIGNSIASSETPLRITETSYFKRKHDEISLSVYKRPKIGSASNCIACHKGAENGYFSEREVSIPKLK